jgi:thioredoxin 1
MGKLKELFTFTGNGLIKKIVLLSFCLLLSLYIFAEDKKIESPDSTSVVKPQITFHEFGSTTCVPCKMMEKVMEEIRMIYGDKVQVIFHNVNTEKELAAAYDIKMIPTQVFLDANGKEFSRHVGFYPTADIIKLFDTQNLK